jgi:transcriptional regulator with XRE-family HTH domain
MQRQGATALDRHIGKRLRALRIERRMSLEKLAEALEVTQQQMSRYELGQNRVGAAQLYRVALGLNVPVGWFFLGYVEQADELQRLRVALREDRGDYRPESGPEREQALVEAWRALPNGRQRDRVLALLEACAFDL